ncbi:MAG: hypothetical protein KGL39_10120 [Patescibacteria group bacterium]|nr:hypothetical protein [Patescibacteria group bacterium]
MASPRILSIRLSDEKDGTGVEIQLGTKTVEKTIPLGFGMIKMNMILDGKNELEDAEIVTQKI